ncbi:phosphotransferase [Lentzea sp. NPDC060358]|uniref:phosphotransferase n=1 Tax=Lentzea sp. NPDC060358 TaxID=3347103 RepID=UPI003654EB31
MDEELLTGGGLNQVFSVGDAVRRPAGPWAPRVHELLRHLAPLGIAPVPLGLDGEHSLLSCLPGDVGHVPPSDDTALVESALLLRRLHGDFAPYNTVLTDGRPTGVFDWDGAHPGPRWWDVSWAVVHFALQCAERHDHYYPESVRYVRAARA